MSLIARAHWLAVCMGLCAALLSGTTTAQDRLSVAYPGPLNATYLPIEVAQKIGADQAEGVQLVVRYTSSGGTALQQLKNRNTDFVVAGLPAAMSAKANGSDVVTIAPISDLPMFVLSVRADLRNKVKRPRDLADRVIGVASINVSAKTISHQMTEWILKRDGVQPEQMRLIAVGQNWEEQSAIIRSKTADALFGLEPFASRLQDAGLTFPLFNLGDPDAAALVPGSGLLQAALHTRIELLHQRPQHAEKMVAVMRRTLEWMAGQTPEQIVETLQIADTAARAALLGSLRQYPRLYSRDGKFSTRQLQETAIFYDATREGQRALEIEEMIDARWAGRKP